MKTITLVVTGMSCVHCEKAVVNAITDLGAKSVTACSKANKVEITYDPASLSIEKILFELDDMGYPVV